MGLSFLPPVKTSATSRRGEGSYRRLWMFLQCVRYGRHSFSIVNFEEGRQREGERKNMHLTHGRFRWIYNRECVRWRWEMRGRKNEKKSEKRKMEITLDLVSSQTVSRSYDSERALSQYWPRAGRDGQEAKRNIISLDIFKSQYWSFLVACSTAVWHTIYLDSKNEIRMKNLFENVIDHSSVSTLSLIYFLVHNTGNGSMLFFAPFFFFWGGGGVAFPQSTRRWPMLRQLKNQETPENKKKMLIAHVLLLFPPLLIGW